jgi:hypothetical protein
MGLFLFNNKDTFPDHPFGYSVAFIILLVVLYVAMIPFAMSISTPFTDSKVANYAGNLILTFPILIFIQLTQTEGAGKNLIYLFFLMPIFPAMTILVKLTESQLLPVTYRVLNVDHIPAAVAWIFLFLCIPLWFAIYIYLDSVMPNTYGVQKHPCFCIRKEDKRRNTYEPNDVEDQES